MQSLPLVLKVKAIKGKGRGKGLGIPTLNFAIPQELSITHGVYAGRLLIADRFYPAAIHFGPRPVFSEADISLEAYILNYFDENIKECKLEFVKFVREIRNFRNPQDMVQQIELDVKEIKKILKVMSSL